MGDPTSLAISGGDSRNVLDPDTLLNKYGCSPSPTDTVAFGSCTSSSPSVAAADAAAKAASEVPAIEETGGGAAAFDALRDRLLRNLLLNSESCDLVFCPSGTDAEYLAIATAMAWQPDGVLCNIVTAPLEVGGGTLPAAGGQYFDEETPNDAVEGESTTGAVVPAWNDHLYTRSISIRDEDGTALDPREIDEHARAECHQAIASGSSVLLHIVAHSKTGVHAPSFECARELQNEYPGSVHVVVDAAQGRFSRRGLGQSLHENDLVIFTGSKFYGGLPFAGALLIPHVHSMRLAGATLPRELAAFFSRTEFPERLWEAAVDMDATWNPGLYVRWSSALAEMERYYAVADERRLAVLRRFEAAAPQWVSASPWLVAQPILDPVESDDEYRLLESKTTVFSFAMRRSLDDDAGLFSLEELREIFRWMYTDLRGDPVLTAALERRRFAPNVLRGFHLGQPVPLSPNYAALRFAIGAATVSGISEGADAVDGATPVAAGSSTRSVEFARLLTQLEYDVCDAVSKLELLAECFDELVETEI